jgi:diguanylate cyclase (GGDEF)-like protein
MTSKGSKIVDENHPLFLALQQLTNDIRLFIELSLQETDANWDKWMRLALKEQEIPCWEKKKCTKTDCPAYGDRIHRCWLTVGTMCGGKVQGEFALKYKSCTECDVYNEAVFGDPVREVYEHVITLVHSLKTTQDKLKNLAIKDPLTGVYNRNLFNVIIANEIERSKRYGDKFSVIMADIDNFKYINDTFGHLHGDRILKECATILTNCVRSSDLLVRYGGDEFIIVTPRVDDDDCEKLISRMEELMARWNADQVNKDYSLSISAGCAFYEQGKDLMDVINEADRKMYENKKR